MITVVKPGLLSTIQDEGRPGYRAFGMPLAGAVDRDAYAVANLLAGNRAGDAAIEMTLLGGAFRFDSDAVVAITGADMQPTLEGAQVAGWSSFPVAAGSVLAFSSAREGCRCYLAVRGGIDVPVVLGSRSTYTRARVGGLQGRALVAGDLLATGPSARPSTGSGRAAPPPWRLPARLVPRYPREKRIRVLLGPQDDRFPRGGLASFLGATYAVSNRNDRMGYQLEGPPIEHARGADIVSDGMIPGSVQVPGNGFPIVMMHDCPTVGGYAKIATAISADLARMAQARTGDFVHFEACTFETALEVRKRRDAWMEEVKAAIERGGGEP